jgi:lysophospholipase L1-like esterase
MRPNLFQPAAGLSALNALRQPIANAAAFLPSDLSGLQLWLETSPRVGYLFTDVGGTVQAVDTNAVAHWKDHSVNGRNLTEATTKPVLADPVDTSQPNSRPTLRFTAASAQKMAAAAAAPWKFLHDGTGCTGFVCYKQTNENVGVLLDTGGYGVGSNTGLMLYADDSGAAEGRIALVINKGTGTPIINLATVVAGANAYPIATWHVLRFSYIESGTPAEALLFGDGCFHLSADSAAAPSASNPTGALQVGLDINGVASNALAFDGDMAAVILYNRVLSLAECRQVENYLSLGWTVPVGNVAVLGDSILAGSAVTRIPATVLANRLGPLWRATNFAVGGARVATGSPQVSSQWSSTTAGAKRRGYNFIVLLAGINDIDNDYGAAATYADLAAIYDDVLADYGNRLICCTVTPWKGNSQYSAGREVERLALNESIRAYVAAHSNAYLVELAGIAADPADPEAMWAPYASADHLHPSQAGSDAMAAAIADKLLAVGLG